MDAIAAMGPSAEAAANAHKSETIESIVDFQEFLNLFVTQLRYQDPLSPLAGDEFLAQTAQFSSVEQLVNLNSKVSASADATKLSAKTTAAALIGKTVYAETLDLEGSAVEVSGRVVQVDFAENGDLVLGLEDGSTIPFAAVLSVGETPAPAADQAETTANSTEGSTENSMLSEETQ